MFPKLAVKDLFVNILLGVEVSFNFSIHRKEQLKVMADRILAMRQLFLERLISVGTPGEWSHIIKQNGMFTFTGLSPEQVALLKDKYHIYMLKSGRINMCGINHSNVEYIAQAFKDAIINCSGKSQI